jgi:hypothetical protein
VSWWLVDAMAGSELEAELALLVPRWLAETWGFRAVRRLDRGEPGGDQSE